MKPNQCKCTPEETTGWTTVKCCNICGLPIQEEVWDFKEANKDDLAIYANSQLVEFVNWFNETNKLGIHIKNSAIGQFNLSQNEKI